jgi:hypothetical protein
MEWQKYMSRYISSLIPDRLTKLPIVFLLLGGCLTFIPQSNSVQAQMLNNEQKSDEQSFQRFVVYVDSDNPQTLQIVHSIEPSAYIRFYNGHNVIQSGIFSQQLNAQAQAQKLESSGVRDVHIIGFTNTEARNSGTTPDNSQPAINSGTTPDNSQSMRNSGTTLDNSRSINPNSQPNNPPLYYVIIPSSYRNLSFLGEQIRQRMGQNSGVLLRTHPRGPHIAVGPFSQRLEAEQWNNYLQTSGYRDARVYYGQ